MTPIALPAIFDLAAAARLIGPLRAACGSIVLDGAAAERIGIAGLQLLLTAHATTLVAGHSFAIERPSAPLQAAARTAGADFLVAASR